MSIGFRFDQGTFKFGVGGPQEIDFVKVTSASKAAETHFTLLMGADGICARAIQPQPTKKHYLPEDRKAKSERFWRLPNFFSWVPTEYHTAQILALGSTS